MEAPFYVGQKVIAVKSISSRVIKGNTYIVNSMQQCPCCKDWFVDFGAPLEFKVNIFECHLCRYYSPIPIGPNNYLCYHKYFAPINDQYADITAEIAAGATETKEQPDKVIIPAKPETAPCENSFS